jgi:glycosyltransferase involved in cell wall biosynthesis
MRCPKLSDLPAPPPGRVGWPWTEQTAPPADRKALPRISIVTPSLNRADMIEETIRSVLLQGYPDLEYAIVDGGSTDGTLGVVDRYRPWLASVVSEPDEGQSDAINKGMKLATGEVLAYLNTDDLYLPGALQAVGEAFADARVQWLSGRGRLFGPNVGWGYTWPERPWRQRWQWAAGNRLCQSSTFWRRGAAEQVGEFDTAMHVSMDQDYWLRMALAGYELTWTRRVLSAFRMHEGSRTARVDGEATGEHLLLWQRYASQLSRDERRRAGRLMRELHARRLRWRAWRLAWLGRGGTALKDCLHAVRVRPALLLSPKTWAVPALTVLAPVLRRLRARKGGGA